MKKEYERVFLNKYGYYELKNKPDIKQRKKEFEDDYYQNSASTYEEEYSDEEKKFFKNKLEQKELIIMKNLKDFDARKGDLSLLDIGCGEGFVLKYFSELGMKVTGIDFSDWAVRHHNPDMLDNLIKGDCMQIIPELNKKDIKFDVINMDSSLDMMLEPEKVVEMCKGILKPGGIMIIKVANNYSNLQQTLLANGQLKKEYWLDEPGHPSYFNKDGFINFMNDHGFECVDFYGESFIDFNLVNERTNYYENPKAGKGCYNAKIQLENMFHDISPEKSLELFRALGEMGFGREIIGVFIL